MREWKCDSCPYLMRKELHLFPVPTAKLEMFCRDRAYVLIPDESRRLKMVYSLPLGWLKNLLSSWGDCRAAWTALVLQGSGLQCLWLSIPQLCVSGCKEELLSHYLLLWEKVRVGTDLCVRKGTKQKERYGQNETAVLLVACSLDLKGSVPCET